MNASVIAIIIIALILIVAVSFFIISAQRQPTTIPTGAEIDIEKAGESLLEQELNIAAGDVQDIEKELAR